MVLMVRDQAKMNISVRGNKTGFTLIELMLAMVIMGIMAALILPTLQQLQPQSTQREFARRFNELCALSWQHALTSQRVHRIMFDLKKRRMSIEVESAQPETLQKEPTFEPLTINYARTDYTWPQSIAIRQFYINGTERLQQIGVKTDSVWFYIVPDGLTQDVIVNVVDTQEVDAQGASLKMGLTVNPFTAQVRRYDTFQKP